MPIYQISEPADPHRRVHFEAVDMDALTSQLIPIRDALLRVFEGVPARSRGELQRLEMAIAVSDKGVLAIPGENTRPVLTLTVGMRPRSSGGRSGTSKSTTSAKRDIVQIEEPSVGEVEPA